MTGAITTYTYDEINRTTGITQSGLGVSNKLVKYTYDDAGKLTGLNRYSDLTGTNLVASSIYGYDTAGRLIGKADGRWQGAGGISIANYTYQYDDANRITQQVSNDGTNNYTYDNASQLTGASGTNESYSYDDNGNRTNSGYSTGNNNQLLNDGTYNYEYDGEGNRTKRTNIATLEVTTYSWDYRNRLTQVVTYDINGVPIQEVDYTYDVNDKRISKTVIAGTTTKEKYVYDGKNIALVFDGSGTQTHRYLYGVGYNNVLADESSTSGQVLWALVDNEGSVKDVVDSNGVVLNHIVYDSFGNVTTQTNSTVVFRFGYTGQELDKETGLYYYHARYYDPTDGRFISVDPIGFKAGDSNLYRYVGNSPTNKVDPTGTEDTRWPGNGVVTNDTNQPVVVVIGNHTFAYLAQLPPHRSTPNQPGYSTDVDAVWVCQKGHWVLYPVEVGRGDRKKAQTEALKELRLLLTQRQEELLLQQSFQSPLLLPPKLPDREIFFGLSKYVVVTNNKVYDLNSGNVPPVSAISSSYFNDPTKLPWMKELSKHPPGNSKSCDCSHIQAQTQGYPNAVDWVPVQEFDTSNNPFNSLDKILKSPLNFKAYFNNRFWNNFIERFIDVGLHRDYE